MIRYYNILKLDTNTDVFSVIDNLKDICSIDNPWHEYINDTNYIFFYSENKDASSVLRTLPEICTVLACIKL